MTNRTRSMFHLLTIGLLALFLSACGGGEQVGDTQDPVVIAPTTPATADEWVLVWSDEFDGTALDTTKWGYDLGDGSDRGLERWGNNEQQWYTADNATVDDGMLTITAKNESVVEGFPYTSSRITTKGKLDVKYGRFEARIKAPGGQGLWGAFWMLSTDSPYGSDGWAATGEIDIMEAANAGVEGNEFFGSTIYHGFPWPLFQSNSQAFPDEYDPQDFNVYAVEWEQDELRFFINDEHVRTILNKQYYSYFYNEAEEQYQLAVDGAPFDTEFHLILNLAVGGNLTGNLVEDGNLPGEMEVDYVRVYRCDYNLPGGGGCLSNASRDRRFVVDSQVDEIRPGTASFEVYTDAPATYTNSVLGETFTRPLALNSFFDNGGALSFSEVTATNRGTVIDVETTGGGNISINAEDGDIIELFGMGNNPRPLELHAGEIRFDMLVRDADAGSQLLVKMDSGFPNLGQVALDADSIPRNEWRTYSVKVNDLIQFRGEGLSPLDTSKVVSLFVFEPTGAASVQLDNITLSCGSPGSCGIVLPGPEAPPITGPWRLPGKWRMTPEPGALGVGPMVGDVTWWNADDVTIETRSCFFDDDYVFELDGSFRNDLGVETWLEPFQTEDGGERCGAPLAPYDGTIETATWEYDAGSGELTIDGFGAYVGIPKAVNAGEVPNVPTPESIVYNIDVIDNVTMLVWVEAGPGVFWQFRMTKFEDAEGGGGGPAPERTLAGGWQVAPEAGSLGVGPGRGDISWWSIPEEGVTARACFYDDLYSFDRDGTFNNVLGDETWIETWQGAEAESCGTPVAPHDGGVDFNWTYEEIDADNGTLTISGTGGYMGIPKAVNGGELPNVSTPNEVVYEVEWIDDNNIYVDVQIQDGAYWRFKKTKTVQPPPAAGGGGSSEPVVGVWRVAPEAGALGVGPGRGDVSWWSNPPEAVEIRSCFFDDDYAINADGSFQNFLGDDTWLEPWQGVAAEECGTPVAPHDGMFAGSWTYDAESGELVVTGTGSYLGIPKAVNGGELPNVSTPDSVTYLVTFEDDNNTMIVDVEIQDGAYWRFVMARQ